MLSARQKSGINNRFRKRRGSESIGSAATIAEKANGRPVPGQSSLYRRWIGWQRLVEIRGSET